MTICASGPDWIGSGVGSIETALHELFQRARFTLVFSIYSLTQELGLLPTWLEQAADRGVDIVGVVNRFGTQGATARETLKALAYSRPMSVHLYDFQGPDNSDIHAKAVVADDQHALIGSSNFSRRGLLTNYEMAVVVEGEAARRAADLVRRITKSLYAVPI
jgi:phosphatidylserine/phosphatidylglycerophosphate/cardiolipin synthase-like enzyme